MARYVAERCDFFLKHGYSAQDIAVLFSTEKDRDNNEDMFLREIRNRTSQINYADHLYMFDSIRRFSGLERSIVFGIDPRAAESIFPNLIFCLASRARKHLYILSKVPNPFNF